jgi:hypothetical protein
VADPADRPAQGEESHGPAGWQFQRPSQSHQTEIDSGTLAYEIQGFFDDGSGERDGRAPGMGRSRKPEQLGAPGISARVQGVPETGHALPTFQATSHDLLYVVRRLGIS